MTSAYILGLKHPASTSGQTEVVCAFMIQSDDIGINIHGSIAFHILGSSRGMTKGWNRHKFSKFTNFFIDQNSARVSLPLQTAAQLAALCMISFNSQLKVCGNRILKSIVNVMTAGKRYNVRPGTWCSRMCLRPTLGKESTKGTTPTDGNHWKPGLHPNCDWKTQTFSPKVGNSRQFILLAQDKGATRAEKGWSRC